MNNVHGWFAAYLRMSLSRHPTVILVVEDEALVGMLLETILEDMGCQPLGPVSTIDEALSMIAANDDIDAVLLDVNLGHIESFPVARALTDKGVPFVFSTGHGAGGLPIEWQGHPTLSKPFVEDAVGDALMKAVSAVRA